MSPIVAQERLARVLCLVEHDRSKFFMELDRYMEEIHGTAASSQAAKEAPHREWGVSKADKITPAKLNAVWAKFADPDYYRQREPGESMPSSLAPGHEFRFCGLASDGDLQTRHGLIQKRRGAE